ncbi:hypothetical protein ACA910_004130 [Epithemia clementina (nom. ined.)]
MTADSSGDNGRMRICTMIGTLVRKKKRENRWVLAIRPEVVQTETGSTLQEQQHSIARNISIPRPNRENVLPYDFLFLFATLRVVYQIDQESTEEEEEEEEEGSDDMALTALDFELVRCAPDPTAVALALQGISEGRFPWTVIPALQDVGDEHNDNDPMQSVCDILALPNPSRVRRLAIARLVRGIEKGPGSAVDKPARTRPPFIRPIECRLLQALEQFRELRTQSASLSDGSASLTSRYEWEWMEPKMLETGVDPEENYLATLRIGDAASEHRQKQYALPLNVPLNAEDQLSFRGRHTRCEYMFTKKMPQVRRMVQRVQQLFSSLGKVPNHIVDVGGGRCDLASSLALTFPSCFVSVVDKNESSLLAGKAYAEQLGCAGRMNFVCSDMGQVVANLQGSIDDGSNRPDTFTATCTADKDTDDAAGFADCLKGNGTQNFPVIDLVVALHACGDLSDLALAFASQLLVPFVVCPCCYTKRYISNFTPIWNQYCSSAALTLSCTDDNETMDVEEKNTPDQCRRSLMRLAEIDDNMHVSRLARLAINSMRLSGMKESSGYDVSMEEYDIKTSRRNIVLVGYR